MIDPTNYTRLFRVQGLRYLICDLWTDHYKTLRVFVTVSNDEFTSYLPKVVVEQTLAEGLAMHTRSEFDLYRDEFDAFMRKTHDLAGTIGKVELTADYTATLLEHFAGMFKYYSKTEFFYNDRAYEEYARTGDETLHRHLTYMGELKNKGREFMNAIYFGDGYFPTLLAALSKKFSVSERDLQQYTRAEIMTLFRDERVPADILKARDLAFYVLGEGETRTIVVGEEAQKEIEAFQQNIHDLTAKDVIVGKIANKGVARGKVRIIVPGYDNFHSIVQLMDEMEAGEVLVSETTSPELMPACQKASAIITDQGGLLSHAAIVSRELNIPCIVGTQESTKLLSTGDLVEVNANEGTIKIIEKAQRK